MMDINNNNKKKDRKKNVDMKKGGIRWKYDADYYFYDTCTFRSIDWKLINDCLLRNLNIILEGKLICSPDQTNGFCQWTLFGWETYHGCGYKQKINERK